MEPYSYDTSLTANGGCYLCGSVNGLVSTEKIIEGEGLLAICSGCINDLAVTAGYVVNGRDEIDAANERARLADEVAGALATERAETLL